MRKLFQNGSNCPDCGLPIAQDLTGATQAGTRVVAIDVVLAMTSAGPALMILGDLPDDLSAMLPEIISAAIRSCPFDLSAFDLGADFETPFSPPAEASQHTTGQGASGFVKMTTEFRPGPGNRFEPSGAATRFENGEREPVYVRERAFRNSVPDADLVGADR